MRWYGEIGYMSYETQDGISKEVITVKHYGGEVLRNSRRRSDSNSVNSELTISNQIRIIADAYAYENFNNIRYAKFNGVKWTVSDIEVQPPGLLLTLGGVYNEQ